jgi:hypothetical protein
MISVANPAAFEFDPDQARIIPIVIADPSKFEFDPDASRMISG